MRLWVADAGCRDIYTMSAITFTIAQGRSWQAVFARLFMAVWAACL